jgi:uncharacterized membrane protein
VFSVVVFSQWVGLVLVLTSLPVLPPSRVMQGDLLWGAAAGLAGGIGLALLYRGLSIGVMSVVAPVTAVCSVILPVAVGLALGERPSVPAAIGVLLAVVAIVLISQARHAREAKRVATGVATAIASGIAIGIFLVCLERTAATAGLWPLVAARVVSISFLALGGLVSRQKLLPRRDTGPSSSLAAPWTWLRTFSICSQSGKVI